MIDKEGCVIIGAALFLVMVIGFSVVAEIGRALAWIRWGFG